jgi:hypothetical protein
MHRKIGINNYMDVTKFENDADIRYLLHAMPGISFHETLRHFGNQMSFQKSKWISGNQINLRKSNDLPYIQDEGENTYRALL